ncbi:sugar ABC transporter substrate-binding protein [Planobispora rosea]|uniref:sugar ABC transporter substrate-binding protein n=1 Tax=Planobispora rosea TaxID=35762 RepID=UPI00083B1496|nr:substrate-binding domain-containing protein [Planobispora rosea]
MKPVRRTAGSAVLVLILSVLALGLPACGAAEETGRGDGTVSTASPGGSPRGGADGFRIGLLLPESTAVRYDRFDHPYIAEEVTALCPTCAVVYRNANRDPGRQEQQVDEMLANDVRVLILDPVDARAIGPAVARAKARGVGVVSYDRLAAGPIDAYVSFDNVEVGRAQGEALLKAVEKAGTRGRGPVVMLNGSPTDPNAEQVKRGAHSVLDGRVDISREYDIPDWSPDQANARAAEAFAELGADKIAGVYAANDGMAAGAAQAMRSAGVPGRIPLTGQDGELAAIQRILLGTQTMTVYKPIRPQARSAARMAVALGTGTAVRTTRTVDNGTSATIPAEILRPIAVTAATIGTTVVADGFWRVEEICAGDVRAACRAAGLI